MTETVELLDWNLHGEREVTAVDLARFVVALPEDVRPVFGGEWVTDLEDIGTVLRDYMMDYPYQCQKRPALPHEREEHGGGWYLTKKGTAKYNARVTEVANAFEQVFGIRPWGRGAKGPVAGPLDPLTYD